MSRLKHILKLILLGPQPKDEWCDEWSKDPLAEWFREEEFATRTLRRRLSPSELQGLLPLGLIAIIIVLSYRLLSRWQSMMVAALIWLYVIVIGRIQSTRGESPRRPNVGIPALFAQGSGAVTVADLWMAGVQGRDIAKMLYLEKHGTDGFPIIVILCMVASSIMAFASWGEWMEIMMLLLLVGVSSIISAGYCFHRARNPFRTRVWGLFGAVIPGARAMHRFNFSKGCDRLNRYALPLWPLLASPVVMFVMIRGEMDGLWHPAAIHHALIALMVLSVVLIHVFVRGRRFQDMPHLEEAFAAADRDFDLWVRTELIGDEDA